MKKIFKLPCGIYAFYIVFTLRKPTMSLRLCLNKNHQIIFKKDILFCEGTSISLKDEEIRRSGNE